MMNFSTLPKIELHVHLEGAAPPEFVKKKAQEKGVELGPIFSKTGGYQWNGFAEFLSVYETACSVLQTPQDYYDLFYAVLENAASHHVLYSEFFVSPEFCGKGELPAWQDYLAALEEAALAANRKFGIEARLIATCVRHFGVEKAERDARLVERSCGEFLTGFGMGGEERLFHASDFARAFEIARGAGAKITSHAGEVCGAPSVEETLDHLKPERIGHGVRAIENPKLVERLAQEAVVLEVNPGSNLAVGVFQTMEDHPIERLKQAGVKVTVSTDDPPFFGTNMTLEYQRLHESFGWGKPEFREINETAIEAAFCDAPTKTKLQQKITEGYL